MKPLLPLLAAAVLAVSCAGTPPADPVEPQPEAVADTAPPEPEESPPADAAATPPPADIPADGPAVFSETPLKAPPGSTATAVTLPPPRLAPSPPPPYPWIKAQAAPAAVPVADYTPADTLPAEPADTPPAAPPRAAPPAEEATLPSRPAEDTPVTPRPAAPADEEPTAGRENGGEAQNLGSLRVPPGEPFDYAVDGQGWIYDGSSPAGVRFIKRTVPSTTTEFTFLAEEEGTYTLTFIYNDIISGLSERALLTLEVGSSEETPPGEWEADLSMPAEEPEPGPPTAEEVVALGFYEALREADKALKGGNDLRALDILNAASRRFADSRDLDRILFALASLYEQNGPLRDLDRALGLYKRITDEYPASIFYNRAAERIIYIERNFIRIR